jgi:uncharacterized membrane protein HdeD (DUF308 family)
MPLPIIILALLVMIAAGIYNIRSLIRKWKHNPNRWDSLLFGILLWTAAIVLLSYFLITKHILA